MSHVRYEVIHKAHINAPADRVYGIISDYQNGHPRILPAAFRNFVVEQGGRGHGTLTRFDVRAFGRTQSFRHEVLEPEPGRVLVERDRDLDSRTTFIVEPAPSGSTVTIRTELRSRGGLSGRLERLLSTRFLQRLYREELGNLEALATGTG
jgi:polyketide cyclase/dehydrase/lipid transport protein